LVALDCNVATLSATAFLSRCDIVFPVITKPMRLMSQRADEADKPTRDEAGNVEVVEANEAYEANQAKADDANEANEPIIRRG
jgi:hypothetical protein